MNNQPKSIKIEAYNDAFYTRGKVAIVCHQKGTNLVGKMVFEEVEEGMMAPPLILATHEELQALADSLWEVGVRPMQAAGSAGQLDATNKHLADMRAIAFQKLNIKPRLE